MGSWEETSEYVDPVGSGLDIYSDDDQSNVMAALEPIGSAADIYSGSFDPTNKEVNPVTTALWDPTGVASGTGAAGGEYGSAAQMAADPMDLFGWQAKGRQLEVDAITGQAKGMESDWLNYVKQQYGPYSEVGRESIEAQRGLAGLGGSGYRERLIGDIASDPLYQAKVAAGDDAVMRNASMTGGLRSGDVSSALASQNQALLSQEIDSRYDKLSGLSGMGLRGVESLTARGGESMDRYSGILGEEASGIIAQGDKSGISGLVGGVMSMFSDERLKTDITKKGERHGMPWYEWTWNETANKKLELFGKTEGHMASDVELKYPGLVSYSDGYRTVDYGGLS